MNRIILVTVTLLASALAVTDYPDCTGAPGSQKVIDLQPRFVGGVLHGRKYIIESPENNITLPIIKLTGTWYDIGYAYGSLMKEEITDAMNGMYKYLIDNANTTWIPYLKQQLPFYLKWIPDLLNKDIPGQLNALLDLQYYFTKAFTPSRYIDEMKGISAGSKVDFDLINRLNLFPEFIRAQCTIAGVWGPASQSGKLLQIRALDWDYKSYIVKRPLAIIYFPIEAGSVPFANFGFAGMVGAISGYSTKIALSQKVWLPISTDPNSEFGEPFTYLLRDMLQFGTNLESSVNILKNGKRTCRVHVGIGSKAENQMEGVMMSFNEFMVYNDKNYTYTDAHPQMDGVMYWDRHVQPSKSRCLGSIFKQNLGKINAEFMYKQAAAIHETGDTQLIIYDFEHDFVFIAHSDLVTKGFKRPLVKLNMANLLKNDIPTLGKEFLSI